MGIALESSSGQFFVINAWISVALLIGAGYGFAHLCFRAIQWMVREFKRQDDLAQLLEPRYTAAEWRALQARDASLPVDPVEDSSSAGASDGS